MIRIGLISDTHGLLRPQALAFLQGARHIVHAGDIGPESLLATLAQVAPLTVVRGNNDREPWAARLPHAVGLCLGGVRLHVVHDRAELDLEPASAGVHIVVCGHSHRPEVAREGSVLYVNPGSAGPRRFRLPISVGEVLIDGQGGYDARVVTLPVGSA